MVLTISLKMFLHLRHPLRGLFAVIDLSDHSRPKIKSHCCCDVPNENGMGESSGGPNSSLGFPADAWVFPFPLRLLVLGFWGTVILPPAIHAGREPRRANYPKCFVTSPQNFPPKTKFYLRLAWQSLLLVFAGRQGEEGGLPVLHL
jgi:hypothetical protein